MLGFDVAVKELPEVGSVRPGCKFESSKDFPLFNPDFLNSYIRYYREKTTGSQKKLEAEEMP